jgi:uncharacterized membrane protein
MDTLTKEQEKQIRRIKLWFMFKSFLTGLNTAALALAINFVAIMATHVMFEDNDAIKAAIALAAALFVVIRANGVIKDHAKEATEDLIKVLKKDEE